MESNSIDIREARYGVPYNITPISDMHIGAKTSDEKRLTSILDARAKLENPIMFTVGDNGNHINPNDPRFMEEVRRIDDDGRVKKILKQTRLTRNDVLKLDVAVQADILKKYPIKMVGLGNHGHSVLNKHGFNPAKELAAELGAVYGGYSGWLEFRFFFGRDNGPRRRWVFLYHHGAWGGRMAKGYNGAKDWAFGFGDWDAFVYGHNHKPRLDPEAFRDRRNCKVVSRPRFILNGGTIQESHQMGDDPDYAERKGFSPSFLGFPLVRIVWHRHSPRPEVLVGYEGW